MEIRPSADVKSQIDQSQVLGEFKSFQIGVQEGFKTHGQSLRSYGSLLYTLDRYFNQDETQNSPDAIDLVKKIFYQHDIVAPVPVEFFVETRDRLKKEVLGDDRRPGDRFREELEFVKGSIRHELQRVTYDFQLDEKDRIKLEQLAGKNKDQVLSANITEDLEIKRETREGKLRQAAVEVLSKDPQTGGEIKRRDEFEKRLRLLIEKGAEGYSEEAIRSSFVGMEDLLVRGDSIAVTGEISARLRRGQTGEITRVLTQVLKDSQGIDTWTRLVSHGLVPEKVTNGFEEVVVLSELQDTVSAISGLPKEAKAFFLLPFFEKGISSGLLYEIVEGNFDLGVDLVSRQFDAFTHFIDIYKEESTNKGLTLRQKLALSAIASMVVTSGFLLFNAENRPPQDEINQILDTIPKSDIEALQKLKLIPGFGLGQMDLEGAGSGDLNPDDISDNDTINLPFESNPASGNGLPSDKEKSFSGADASGSANNRDSFSETPPQGYDKPKNDSSEEMERGMKSVVWYLQGKNLRRFYRTNTAANFDSRNKTWIYKNDFAKYKNQSNLGANNITLSEDIVAHNQWIKLPVPPGYIFGSVYTFAGMPGKPDIYVSSDGDYMLKIPRDVVGQRIQFAYGVSEKFSGDKDGVIQPTKQELLQSLKRLANMEDLPEDIQKFLTDLNRRHDLSTGVKAKVLEQYVQNNFLYSQDTKWSDYYHKGKNSREFVKRIFEIRKTDCDVANTALIAMLRIQGIPARLALGYAHYNPMFNPNEKTLTESEGHGLAQIYVNGKWEYLDATPVKPDELTQKALSPLDHSEEKRSPVVGPKRNNDEWDGTWRGIWGSSTPDVNEFFAKTALIYLLNTAAWLGADKLRVRNNAIAQRLSQEIDRRGITYFGDGFAETRDDVLIKVKSRELYGRVDKERSTRLLLAIPTASFIDAIIKTRDTLKLSALPFNNGTVLPETSSRPDTFDFLTSVLGYEEDNITRRMLNRAYRESKSQVANQMTEVTSELGVGLYQGWEGGRQKFIDQVSKRLEVMRIPANEADWEKSKKLTSDRLYSQYILKYKKSTEDYETYNSEIVQEPMLSRDKFQSGLDELFGCKLILWQMQRARREAMEGLDLGFKDRVLEKIGRGESKVF